MILEWFIQFKVSLTAAAVLPKRPQHHSGCCGAEMMLRGHHTRPRCTQFFILGSSLCSPVLSQYCHSIVTVYVQHKYGKKISMLDDGKKIDMNEGVSGLSKGRDDWLRWKACWHGRGWNNSTSIATAETGMIKGTVVLKGTAEGRNQRTLYWRCLPFQRGIQQSEYDDPRCPPCRHQRRL